MPERSSDRAWASVGEFIKTQRNLAQLSLRQLADRANVSNPYLSQIERGLYRPSAQVLKALADALHVSAESLYTQVGLLDEEVAGGHNGVVEAIHLDTQLSAEQKATLIAVYRSYLSETPPPQTKKPASRRKPASRSRTAKT